MWETRNELLSFGDGNTAGSLETTPKAARVGYGVKMLLPSAPNYVTRSPGSPYIIKATTLATQQINEVT